MVGRGHRFANVDRRRPGECAVERKMPVVSELELEVGLEFDAIGVHFFEIARRKETFGGW